MSPELTGCGILALLFGALVMITTLVKSGLDALNKRARRTLAKDSDIRPISELFEELGELEDATDVVRGSKIGPDEYVYTENGVEVVAKRGTPEYEEISKAIGKGRF